MTKKSMIRASVMVATAALALGSCAGTDDGGNALCGSAYNPNSGRTYDFSGGMGMNFSDGGMTMVVGDGGMTMVGDAGAGDGGITHITQPQISAQASLGLQINAFLDTSAALVKTANAMNAEMLDICTRMATDLKLAPVTVPEGESATKVICNHVAAGIDAKIKLNLPVNAHLTIVAEPAQCFVSASFTHSCIETCEQKEITETEVHCKPGKISGTCSATCTGTCSGMCSAQCTAECSGTCTGSCSGTCKGKCNGTCSLKNAEGECIGTCTGTCTGTCDATCMGSCSGSCSASCNGSCSGSCRGGCDVAYTAPQCEEVEIMRTVNDCTRSCDTQARAEATCTPPSLTVDFAANITPAMEAELKLVIDTLKTNLPHIYKLVYRAGTVVLASAQAYASQAGAFINAAGDLSLQAGACLVAAGDAIASAFGQISVVAQVSVSVSVSAEAKGNAQI